MKFFNIDLHISVIEDVKNIFSEMGHEVHSQCISGHNWVFNREPAKPDIINQNTWKSIDQSLCDKFYLRYKNELSDYDGFICCYPPAFALLYEKFEKPIFIIAATRYEYPCSDSKERYAWLNSKLISMIDSGQIVPIANNKYDKMYCEYFLKREFIHIPSICSYTNSLYSGSLEPIVSGRSNIQGFNHILSLGRYTWSDLYSHRCIIHIPYNVSLMSLFEQYTANVPLFFPTINFGKKLPGYLSEIIFYPNVIIRDSSSFIKEEHLNYCDFYDDEWMPFLQYYDSLDDLYEKINNTDYKNISESMRLFNKVRRKKIKELWHKYVK